MIFLQLLLCSCLIPVTVVFGGINGMDGRRNLTKYLQYRNKRSLIFEGGGQIKFVVGPALPLEIGDPIAWRALVCTYNLQGGHYNLPTEPLYPWEKWEETFARSMQRAKNYLDNFEKNSKPDDSRLFVYTALETLLNRQNGNKGRACLLRAICENAQVDHHVGMLAEMLNVILTPGKETLDPVYKEAHVAGASGVDCLKLYAECPAGANLLDRYLDHI